MSQLDEVLLACYHDDYSDGDTENAGSEHGTPPHRDVVVDRGGLHQLEAMHAALPLAPSVAPAQLSESTAAALTAGVRVDTLINEGEIVVSTVREEGICAPSTSPQAAESARDFDFDVSPTVAMRKLLWSGIFVLL